MKKIILLLLILIPIRVNAEIIYTNFYLKEKSFIKYEDSDLIKREETEVYNNYKNLKTNEEYYALASNPSYSPFIDLNDHISLKYYINAKSYNSEGPFTNFLVRKLKTVKFLQFRSFQAPKAILNNIKIYNKDKIVNYKIKKTNYDFNSLINSSTDFLLELDDSYNILNLTIETNFTDPSLSRIAYMISAYSEYVLDLSKREFFSNEIIRGNSNETYKVSFLNNDDFKNFIKKVLWINTRDYESTTEVNYYQYFLTKYKYYNINKLYLNDYTQTPLNDCILDYNDHKILYTYYQRDVINIKDEVCSIDDYNNLIIDSSIPVDKLNIESNININRNGDYLMKIKYRNETLYKRVKVNIDQNNAPEEMASEKTPTTAIVRVSTTATISTTTRKVVKNNYNPTTTTSVKKVLLNYPTSNPNCNCDSHIRSNKLLKLLIICLVLTLFFVIIHKK